MQRVDAAPMLGAQRRVEARIGQLDPAPGQGTRTDLTSQHDEKLVALHDQDRADLRILARGGKPPLPRAGKRFKAPHPRERLRVGDVARVHADCGSGFVARLRSFRN